MSDNKLSKSVINVMSAENKFRESGFSLHEGFAGKYGSFTVIHKTYGESKTENNFRLRCKSDSGSHSLAGYMVANTLIVPKGTDMPEQLVKEDAPNVHYFSDAGDVTRLAVPMYTKFEASEDDFEFPESFKVLGACVGKDTVGDHPYIPLSRYPKYKTFLAHHEKVTNGDTFLTRDDIDSYLKLKGEDRPVGIPEGFKFELRNHKTAVMEMGNWMPTLIIEDWRTDA